MEKTCLEISENGIVWDQETNALLGHYPKHLAVPETLKLLSDLRLRLPKIELVIAIMRMTGLGERADELQDAIDPLLAIRDSDETVNERMVA